MNLSICLLRRLTYDYVLDSPENRPLLLGIHIFDIFSPSGPYIHVLGPDNLCLMPEFVPQIQQNKHWNKDIIDYKIFGAKWI